MQYSPTSSREPQSSWLCCHCCPGSATWLLALARCSWRRLIYVLNQVLHVALICCCCCLCCCCCCRYRDVNWLRKERRWPPALSDSLQALLQLKSV
jgi:hypothetical protein